MRSSKKTVLFFSSGDSTRSQIAEGFLRAQAGADVDVVSTAVRAKQVVPDTAGIMREVGIDISQQRPKTVSETFRRHFTCVVTLCEMPRERCPLWPFTRHIFQWDVADPVQSPKSPVADDLLRKVRDDIGVKVKEFVETTLPTL
jgi:protein-tyrosine-phosphatase